MRKSRITLVIFFLFVVGACAPSYRVYTDENDRADFSTYRTFRFMENDQQRYAGLVEQRIRQAVTTEMEARGYTQADSADIWIALDGRVQEKRQLQVEHIPQGPYYWGWDGYTTREYRFREGSLVIDLVDAKQRQLVWQGGVIGIVTNETLSESEIQKAVHEIFERFPHRVTRQ